MSPGRSAGPTSDATRDARQLAQQVLSRVDREKAYANLVLSSALKRCQLDAADRALTTELVYGVLRYRRRLDWAIGKVSRRQLKNIEPQLLTLLRIAAYQLFVLQRIPRYAAVDRAVEAAKRFRGARAAGFVNAVLRQLEPGLWVSDLPSRPRHRLAIECALPTPLAQYFCHQLGFEEARRLGQSLLQPSSLVVRANPVKTDLAALERTLIAEGADVCRGSLSPLALRVCGLEAPFSTASYRQGLWTAQDEAAQLVAAACKLQPGATVLDACAGLGGKSTQLAATLGGTGRLVAADRSETKLALLREHCRRLGLRCETRCVDLCQAGALEDVAADVVILDAPCSALGLLRRHPELKWRDPLSRLPHLVQLQRQLLTAVLGALKPGGLLVYSVCSVTAEEGPEQAQWLASGWPQLRPAPLSLAAFCGQHILRLWPHVHDTDGFFIARFRATG